MNKKILPIILLVIVVIAAIIVLVVTLTGGDKASSKLKTAEDIQKMLNDIYSKEGMDLPELETSIIDVNEQEQVTAYTGLQSNKDIEQLVISVPFINAQAYHVAVIKAKNGADIEKMKQEIYDNINMRMWVCVSAEKLYITNSGNIIFAIMSSEEWAKPVYDEFKNYVGGKIGKELLKTESLDYDLPEEMY